METVKRSEISKDFLSCFSGIVSDIDGTKSWYLNGNLHREDGPAIEWGDGDKWWYIDGLYRGNNKCSFTFYQPTDSLGKDKTNVTHVVPHGKYPKVKIYTLNDGFGGAYEQYIIPGMEGCINSYIQRPYGKHNIPALYTGEILYIEQIPLAIGGNSIKCWYKDGNYHREDGPAVEYSDGDKHWWFENRFIKQINLKDFVVLDHDKGEYGILWYKLLDKDEIIDYPDLPGLITK